MNLPQLSTALIALAASAVLTPLVMLVVTRLGIVDQPDGRRKLHGRAVPLAGGLAVWLAMVAAVWGGRYVGGPSPPEGGDPFWPSFLIASCLLCVLGLADDAWKLRARHKLLGQFAAVGVIVWGGLVVRSVNFCGWDVDLGVMAVPFTIFWLLGAINAMNLIDGMDGLAATVGVTIGSALAVMAALNGSLGESVVAAGLVGGVLGFLVYNFPPARVFLGDTGS
ncbi:MAG TPA: MraY family glycosyltransferase, partial [Planctomycetaceae bacterium]